MEGQDEAPISRVNAGSESVPMVRTEDMGYKLTGNIGYTSNWADALGKCVTDGTETEIYEFGGQRSFYGDGAVSGVWSFAQDGP
jgi:hypothetical protein